MPASPKTTPKANAAKEAAVSQNIGADVDSAVHNFRELEANLKELLASCNDQHAAMLHLNEKRLQVASNFGLLAAGTPLHQVVGAFNVEEVTASLFKDKTEDVEDADEAKEEQHPDDAARSERSSDKKSSEEKREEETDEIKEMKELSIGPPLKTAPAEFFDIDNSFASVHQTSYKLSGMYMNQYYEQAIQYVQDWLKVISDRVNSRLMEFESHQEKLSHYRGKVEKLNAEAEKQAKHNKTLSPKRADKLERNMLKLNGAREAHDSYGESLYLFMDEVTERAWKDMYPLLLRTFEFDRNYSRDQAKVFTKLTKTVTVLKSIGDKEGLDPTGRLHELKVKKPEELYTGEQEVVRPVSKSPVKQESDAPGGDEKNDTGDEDVVPPADDLLTDEEEIGPPEGSPVSV